jgi:hypothetical protein
MQAGFDAAKPSVPQYAEFDTGNKKDADSLPAMPTWEDANSKKVLVEEEAVEMEPLRKPQTAQTSVLNSMPNRSHATSPRAVSPGNMSAYGSPAGTGGPSGHMAAGHNDLDLYGSNQHDHDRYDNYGYDYQNSPANMNSMTGVATAGPLGRPPPPHHNYNGEYDQGDVDHSYSQYPQSRSPRPYNDEYGRREIPTSYDRANTQYQGMLTNDGYVRSRKSPGPQAGYGYENPTRMGSPGAQAGYGYGNSNARSSPSPQTRYGYSQPSRMRDEYPQQPYSVEHQNYQNRAHNDSPLPPAAAEPYARPSPPLSPIRNNSGFDFNSGYSRSTPRASPAPAALTPAPPPTQTPGGGSAYPGYRSYKPVDTQKTQQQHDWDGL